MGQPSCVVDGGPHCLQKFTQHSGGTNLLQRFQWLHENKGRSWESQPGTRVEKTRWPFKSGQRCVPRVFNGDRKGLRKTPLYMLFSTIVCNSALTAPGQKPRDRERGKEGGRRDTEGVSNKKEGRYTPKDKVLELYGSGVSECLGSEGEGLHRCRISLFRSQ